MLYEKIEVFRIKLIDENSRRVITIFIPYEVEVRRRKT